jgi:hypothetical protein
VFTGRDGSFLLVDAVQLGLERRRLAAGQRGRDGPILLGTERFPLLFPVADQFHRDRLDPPHAQAAADFLPQQLAALITDDSIQNTPRLLGMHQFHVDLPWRLQRTFDSRFRDLVEEDPIDFPVFLLPLAVDLLGDMPGDRLAFAVRIRREKHLIGLLRFLLDLSEHFGFALDRDVLRLEIAFDVDAEFAGRQVFDMADGSHDGVPATQVLRNRPGLRRRFNNDQ